jgi:hypothetical protein
LKLNTHKNLSFSQCSLIISKQSRFLHCFIFCEGQHSIIRFVWRACEVSDGTFKDKYSKAYTARAIVIWLCQQKLEGVKYREKSLDTQRGLHQYLKEEKWHKRRVIPYYAGMLNYAFIKIRYQSSYKKVFSIMIPCFEECTHKKYLVDFYSMQGVYYLMYKHV